MKILLIEPDTLLARNYRQALESAGHSVRRTADAQTAVHALDEDMADVIVLELQIPSHNGVELLYELRSYAEWQTVPMIIQSLVPEEDIAGAGDLLRQLGVAAYLYKPRTKLRHLIQAIDRLPQPSRA